MATKLYKLFGAYVAQEVDAKGNPTGEYAMGPTRFRALDRVTWERGEVTQIEGYDGLFLTPEKPKAKEPAKDKGKAKRAK